MAGGDPLLYSFFSFLGFQSRLCPPALAREALLGPGGLWILHLVTFVVLFLASIVFSCGFMITIMNNRIIVITIILLLIKKYKLTQ